MDLDDLRPEPKGPTTADVDWALTMITPDVIRALDILEEASKREA